MQLYYVYIITNKNITALYTGITSNLQECIRQHKDKAYKGFSNRYECNKLVYYEIYPWGQEAIAREKQLKSGLRQRKGELIISVNPQWNDLTL